MSERVIRFEQFIAAPPEPVFRWFAQHQNFGKLFPGNIRRLRPSDEAQHPDGLGAEFEFRMLGMRLLERVKTFEPPRLIEYEVIKGFPLQAHQSRLSFEPVDGGTRLTFDTEYRCRVPFWGQLLTSALSNKWRRELNDAMEEILSGDST